MPPEPLPWDRKDFFKEKKHDRLDSVGPVSRWRDSHQGSREFSRWGPDDYRRPLGYDGRQGGYQLFPEESGYGCTPSRSSERMVEDESNFRPFTYRGNNWEVRGSISERDWRGHPRETGGDAFVNLSSRHHDLSVQRPVSDLVTSHHSDIENSSWDQPHFKDEHDKMGSFDGLGTGHRYERDRSLGSIPWNRMKWNWSSSLSSRGLGFSHSIISRSMRTGSDETKPELSPGGTTSVRSLSRDPAGAVPFTMNEETCSRKKQRLGWGQGMAKYEKQKVEVPDGKPDTSVTNPKTTPSIIPTSSERSRRVTGLSECSSPPTPSSLACSSSPVMDDKPHTEGPRDDNHVVNSGVSPSRGFENFVEGFSVNLEQLELTQTSNLSCLLMNLLQLEDANSGDSNFVRSTAMNKLLLLKTEFLKAVEMTEGEIDMFENELKLLTSEPDTGGPCPSTSESLQVKFELKPCEVVGTVSKVLQKPAPLQLVSGDGMPMDKTILCDDIMRECQAEVEDDIDGPGTATLKFVEPALVEKTDTTSQQSNLLVKEKLLARQRFQRFKERVLTLKYRALQHLWKDDMHLLSIRKYRSKSHKRFESSLRILHNGHQKHRSCVRSRFTSPGNLTLLPTTSIVDFTSKLLSDSQVKLHRSSLKMPALILDKKERSFSSFVTNNGLVEDPFAVEKERVMINPWTPVEKEAFLEMLATFGKDFKRIAAFLDHKTTADCIEFYYKNHKSESFEKIKIKLEPRKQGKNIPTNTYLVTSGKKWNREANAVSLDVLGAASVIASHTEDSVKTQQSSVGRLFLGRHCDSKSSSSDFGKSNSLEILGNEREAEATDVLAGICSALSSEAVSSCITSSMEPMEDCQKRSSTSDCPLTPEVMQKLDCQEACSDESCGELDSMDWTDEEKSIFIRAFRSYHKNFMKISRCVRTRSEDQCNIFFSKARKSLGLDGIQLGSGNEGALLSDDDSGRSDTEDACVLEMDSAICSTQSCTKMDVDLPMSVANTNDNGSDRDRTSHIHTKDRKLEKSNGLKQLDCEGSDQRKEVPDDCWAAVKPELALDGVEKLVKITERKVNVTSEMLQCDDGTTEDAKSSCDVPVQGHGNADFAAETKTVKEQGISGSIYSRDEPLCAGRPADTGKPKPDAAVECNCSPGVSVERLKSESAEGGKFPVMEVVVVIVDKM